MRVGLPAQLRKILAVLAVSRDVPLSTEQSGHLRRLFAGIGDDAGQRSHGGYQLATEDPQIADWCAGAGDCGPAVRSPGR
jgi:hypothetical protein